MQTFYVSWLHVAQPISYTFLNIMHYFSTKNYKFIIFQLTSSIIDERVCAESFAVCLQNSSSKNQKTKF